MARLVLFIAPLECEVVFAGTVGALHGVAQHRTELAFKDMEFARFLDPSRWMDWTLDTEVAAIELLRQRSETHTLDLVGYSGGGAVALAYAVAHPEVLASLTLIEPPWIGKPGVTVLPVNRLMRWALIGEGNRRTLVSAHSPEGGIW